MKLPAPCLADAAAPAAPCRGARLRRLGVALACAGLLVACGRSAEEGAPPGREDTSRASPREPAQDGRTQGRESAQEQERDLGQQARSAAMGAASEARSGASAAEAMASDARITATVKMGLAADKDLSAGTIEVDTKEGVVTLKGPAPTMTAKARASEIARNVRDVRSVDNQLVVPGG